MLRGEALWEGTESGQLIKRFRAVDLPTDPAARFDALFRERALWLWDDLEPCVSSMAVRAALCCCCCYIHTYHLCQGNAEAVLLKYARVVQPHADDPVQYARR